MIINFWNFQKGIFDNLEQLRQNMIIWKGIKKCLNLVKIELKSDEQNAKQISTVVFY